MLLHIAVVCVLQGVTVAQQIDIDEVTEVPQELFK